MRKSDWMQVIPGEDLLRWLRLYRGLWARKAGGKGSSTNDKTPGPWAEFYQDDVRVLERAVREWMA